MTPDYGTPDTVQEPGPTQHIHIPEASGRQLVAGGVTTVVLGFCTVADSAFFLGFGHPVLALAGSALGWLAAGAVGVAALRPPKPPRIPVPPVPVRPPSEWLIAERARIWKLIDEGRLKKLEEIQTLLQDAEDAEQNRR